MQKRPVEKAAEVKAAVKATETKAVVKAEEVKAEAKEVVAKKAETVVKKAEETVKNEDVVANVIERAKEAFTADGHRASSIKSLKVYLKPEEYAAYYVINDTYAGKVNLF